MKSQNNRIKKYFKNIFYLYIYIIMIKISKAYKYIVLILLVFLFAVTINKFCKSKKETLDNPPLNRTFNADQYLKSLQIETDELSVKQKFIDAIQNNQLDFYWDTWGDLEEEDDE